MPFSGLDTAAIARALSQVGDRPGDLTDAYFEIVEDVELPPEDVALGIRLRREEGLAIRLVRGGRTWLASRDAIEPAYFGAALRQVARALPVAAYPEPRLDLEPERGGPMVAEEVYRFPRALQAAVRKQHAAFPIRLTVRRHRRWIQVVGPRLVPAPERESFYSLEAAMPWGRFGTLLAQPDAAAVESVAGSLVSRFRARQAAAPPLGKQVVILGPAATAVFLHEAVAHALEADILAVSGNPDAALGLELGAKCLDVLDHPAASPLQTARRTDDEGVEVSRRWMLRSGSVEQPLADRLWAQVCEGLVPGAGWRATRHLPPLPRSRFLEMLPGTSSLDDLMGDAEAGLFVPEADRGQLDPLTGRFRLRVPFAQRIRKGVAADTVGSFELSGAVAELLSSVTAVGRESEVAGAGWCAKGGQKLPVWAQAPAIRLEGVEVVA